MAFLQKIKKTSFWANVMKVGFIFLIIISIVSLLFYSFKDLITFNWDAVAETNFNDGKWKRFFASKIIASFIYGIFITSKNTK
ncbi:MAG: hypothetical protein JXQ93_07770 [Flavobacteriaceae bacterium]